jgi:hypothetical protein
LEWNQKLEYDLDREVDECLLVFFVFHIVSIHPSMSSPRVSHNKDPHGPGAVKIGEIVLVWNNRLAFVGERVMMAIPAGSEARKDPTRIFRARDGDGIAVDYVYDYDFAHWFRMEPETSADGRRIRLVHRPCYLRFATLTAAAADGRLVQWTREYGLELCLPIDHLLRRIT